MNEAMLNPVMKCFRNMLTVAVLAIPAPGFCTEVSLILKQGQVLRFVTTATKQGVVGIALSNKCRDSFMKLNRWPEGRRNMGHLTVVLNSDRFLNASRNASFSNRRIQI